MVGIGWLLAIVIGALAGWLAGKIMHSSHGLLLDIVLGIVGAVIGNFVLMAIFRRDDGRASLDSCSWQLSARAC